MDVRVGPWRRLSVKELMFLNCGVGEDSWESLGLQGDPTSPPWIFTGRTDAEAETPITLATWCKELSFEKTLMLGKIEGRRRRGRQRMRWLDSINHLWVWASSRRWWRTGKPGMLYSMGSQRVRHDWVTELNQTWAYGSRFAQVSRLDGGKIYVSTQRDSKSTYLLLEV